MIRTLLISAAIFAGATVAHAQTAPSGEMTQQQIEEAFAKQRTRGLVIAPGSQTGGTAPAVTTETGTQVSYADVPQDEQVNIAITFDFDSSALRADQKPRLVGLCNAMKASGDSGVFRVVGHTDSSGSASYNERLSLLRAQEVKRHLVEECGLAADRLEAVGAGMRYPYDPANPRADVNRRVEFQVAS